MTKPSQTKSKSTSSQLDGVDTLTIVVTLHQIGWRCRDGILRRFGSDGDSPSRVELYRELGEVGEPQIPSTLRHLTQRYYHHAQETLAGDFSAVELLLDKAMIQQSLQGGLKRLILWGTDQPQDSPSHHEDTLWLAQLMAGQVRSQYPQLPVEVIHPLIDLANRGQIRRALTENLFPLALQGLSEPLDGDRLVLAIQTTGCASAIAEELASLTAALARHCQVVNVTPIPNLGTPEDSNTTETSIAYQCHSVGNDLWSLDRGRMVEAWERGDFKEAQMWLAPHPTPKGKVLYGLAQRLLLLDNGEVRKFVRDDGAGIGNWLQSQALIQLASPDLIQSWQQHLNLLRDRPYAETWESIFSLYLRLKQGNYTRAFLPFVQLLEQLLYLQYKRQKWVSKNYLSVPDSLSHLGDSFQPGLKMLMDSWFKATKESRKGPLYKLFERICNTRSIIFHEAEALPYDEILLIWSRHGWPVEFTNPQYLGLMQRMEEVLKLVCNGKWEIPEPSLGRSLYEWGLGQLTVDSI